MAYPWIIQDDNLRKGPWLEEEDERLSAVVALLGERKWDALAKASGLRRSGKSCRMRWMNYLRPNIKHGNITPEEERLIIQLQKQWGNRWARIARRLPGRTDNEIKNYWRSYLRKKAEVEEQELFCNNAKKNADYNHNQSISKCKSSSPCSSSDDCISGKDGILGSSSKLSAAEAFSYANAFSPYESGLSDWVSYWSPQNGHMENDYGDWCSSVNSTSLCYPELTTSGCNDISLWDSSYAIWTVD